VSCRQGEKFLSAICVVSDFPYNGAGLALAKPCDPNPLTH
jgi:hypothetical protein